MPSRVSRSSIAASFIAARNVARLAAIVMLAGTAGLATAQSATQTPAPATPSSEKAQSSPSNAAPAQPAEPLRAIAQWNTEKIEGSTDVLGLKGYDPVAYFPEGGGKPSKGDAKITASHKGVRYQFASTAHRDLFLKSPSRYEPAFGGWCAWAMLDGEKVDFDPNTFLVSGNRLFVFYNGFWGDTRAKWTAKDKDQAAEAKQADTNWKKLSGELPRDIKPAADANADTAKKSEAGASQSGSQPASAPTQAPATTPAQPSAPSSAPAPK